MARQSLSRHRKFLRLARAMKAHCPIGAKALARGLLELMWESAYETASEHIGTAEDLVSIVEWGGDAEQLASDLERAGFIERAPDREDEYQIHDLWQHAPNFVEKRVMREVERIEKGLSISEIRAEAGRLGAKRTNELKSQQMVSKWSANGRQMVGKWSANVRQKSSLPSPPLPKEEENTNTGAGGRSHESVVPAAEQGATPPMPPSVSEASEAEDIPPHGDDRRVLRARTCDAQLSLRVSGAEVEKPPKRRSSKDLVDIAALKPNEQALVSQWQEQCKRQRSTPTEREMKLLRECLCNATLGTEFGVSCHALAELAIKGCSLSKWHMGENDRSTRYNDLGLIFRDPVNIRRFVELALAARQRGGDLGYDPNDPMQVERRLRQMAEQYRAEQAALESQQGAP